MPARITSKEDLNPDALVCRGNGHAWDYKNERIEILAKSDNGNTTNYLKIRECLNGCGCTIQSEFVVFFEDGHQSRRLIKTIVDYPDNYLWAPGARKNGGLTRAEWGAEADLIKYRKLRTLVRKNK